MLHAVIHAATSSWPPLFFREGYAESYEHNSNQISIAPAIENRKIVFALLQDGTFVEFIISR